MQVMGGLSTMEQDAAVCRDYLDGYGVIPLPRHWPLEKLSFVQVCGLTSIWDVYGHAAFDEAMADVAAGLAGPEALLAYVLLGDSRQISLYIGTWTNQLSSLVSALAGTYPHIALEPRTQKHLQDELAGAARYGGLITGYPTRKTDDHHWVAQMERVCRGMLGQSWAYIMLASGISPDETADGRARLLVHLSQVAPEVSRRDTLDALGRASRETTNYQVKDYVEHVTALVDRLQECMTRGGWYVTRYYAGSDEATAVRLANLLRAAFGGKDSTPDPIRCLALEPAAAAQLIPRLAVVTEVGSEALRHPAGRWHVRDRQFGLYHHRFQTVLSSRDLAVAAPALRQEFPGYYVNRFVEFDVHTRRTPVGPALELGPIALGNRATANQYQVDIQDLTRHGLIAGVTGSGKTTTGKFLLATLADRTIPFLVIESAKQEYWEMANLGLGNFRVITPGCRDVAYRINPFEPVGRTPLQTHIDYLLATFKASFDLFPPLPHLLETCVYEVYSDRGWDIATSENRFDRVEYPMLVDLLHKIDVVVGRMGYESRIQSDLSASLHARVASLLAGNKGEVLNCRQSVPIRWLLEAPTVVELEQIGDDDVKSFLIGLLLVQLYEYRKDQGPSRDQLRHVLFIEEAHRLLRSVPAGAGDTANPRARAVEFFSNLLAEVRSYGQGILIADQIPTKLASDTLRNTNLKIAHRIVVAEDREAMGRAMNMTPEQIEYLSTLPRGTAAVYAEGDHHPKLVQIKERKATGNTSRSTVITGVAAQVEAHGWSQLPPDRRNLACSFCLHWCTHGNAVSRWAADLSAAAVESAVNLMERPGHSLTAEVERSLRQNLPPFEIANPGFEVRLCQLGALLWRETPKLSASQKKERIIAYVREHAEAARKGGK